MIWSLQRNHSSKDNGAQIQPDGSKNERNDDGGQGEMKTPNGGFVGWLQVAGSFFIFFNTWYVFLQLKLLPSTKFRVHGRKLIAFFLCQGNSKLIRRLSNLLRNITSTFSECLEYLMDRFHPSLSAFRRWRFDRSHLRRRLHGSPTLRWHLS